MSGGSWNYAGSKLRDLAEDLAHGRERSEHRRVPHGQQHPLRKALGRHAAHLADVFEAIEWSDSGDSHEDAWMEPTKEFLDQYGIDVDSD